MKKGYKFLIFIFTVALLGGSFFFANETLNKIYAQEQKENQTGSSALLEDGRVNVEKIANVKKVSKAVDHELLFLLTGVDQNEHVSGEHTRSDTMMLFKLDFDSGDVDLISLPRDSRVWINGKLDKLNHAHAYGGVELLMETLRDFLNIDLDYYVEVNFEAVENIVDAIGGIDYEVPKGINFTYEGITVHEGYQTLNGIEALMYLRHRASYSEGDLGRVRAQQDFLKEVFRQTLQPENITKIPQLLYTYFTRVKTNLSWDQILGMIPMIQKLNPDGFHTHIIPGEGQYIGDVSYYIVDEEGTEELIRDVLEEYIIPEWNDEVKHHRDEEDSTEEEDSEDSEENPEDFGG